MTRSLPQIKPSARILPSEIIGQARFQPLMDYLTTPQGDAYLPSDMSPEEKEMWQKYRPLALQQLPPYLVTSPANISLNHSELLQLIDDPNHSLFMIEGSIYVFPDNSRVPQNVHDALITLCQEGWASKIDLLPLTNDKKGDRSKPRFPRPQDGEQKLDLNWESYIVDRLRRWGNPSLTPTVSLDEERWLLWFPQLRQWLNGRLDIVEPQDLVFLRKLIASLKPLPEKEITEGTLVTVRRHIQGVLGEVWFRPRLIEHYRQIHAREPRAVLILERETTTPKPRPTSDALIGVIENGEIQILSLFELTTDEQRGYASPQQIEHNLATRFPKNGLDVTDHQGKSGWLRVKDAPPSTMVWVIESYQQEELKKLAESIVSDRLRLASVETAYEGDKKKRLHHLTREGLPILQKVLPERLLLSSLKINDVENVLDEIALETPHLGPFWARVKKIFYNMYGTENQGRESIYQLELILHMSPGTLRAIETLFRQCLAPAGLMEVPFSNINAAMEAGKEPLAQVLSDLQRRQQEGEEITVEIVYRTLLSLYQVTPEAALYWNRFIAIFENVFVPTCPPRQSNDNFAKSIGAGTRFEENLITLLSPFGLKQKPYSDLRAAIHDGKPLFGEMTMALYQRYLQGEIIQESQVREGLAGLKERHPECLPFWNKLEIILSKVYGSSGEARPAPRYYSDEVGLDPHTIHNLEEFLMAELSPLGLEEQARDNFISSKLFLNDHLEHFWSSLHRMYRSGHTFTSQEIFSRLSSMLSELRTSAIYNEFYLGVFRWMYLDENRGSPAAHVKPLKVNPLRSASQELKRNMESLGIIEHQIIRGGSNSSQN